MDVAAVAEANPPKQRHERLAILAGVALIALLALKCAWVSDDAYITFRVVDNLVHGHGLRWNSDERVQAYTHPAWMGLVAAFYAFTREPYFTSMALGLALTSAAVWWLAMVGARDLPGAALAVLVFAGSKAFVDFSTSGLENPLLHLALVGALLATTASAPPLKRTTWLALACSGVALARLDGLLLVLPLALLHLARHRGAAHLGRWALGLLPLVAWELFSLVYYGSFVPNTAYAKLSTGIPGGELARQGLEYLLDSLRRDPSTLIAIGAALAVAAWKRERVLLAVAAGIVLDLAYVVSIGGDFMSGRFLTAPLVAAVFVLAHAKIPSSVALLASAAAVLLSVARPSSPLRAPLDYSQGRKPQEFLGDDGICDERGYWYAAAGLLSPQRPLATPPYRHISKGHGFAFELRDRGPKVTVANGIGYLGYWAGPTVHIVDPMGLSDALLARLPVAENGRILDPDKNRFRDRPWRIGHFTRPIPQGYVESLQDPSQRIADPEIAALRADLDLITRGPLWSAERWRAIARHAW